MDIPSLILIRLVRDGSISNVGPLEMDPSPIGIYEGCIHSQYEPTRDRSIPNRNPLGMDPSLKGIY